MAENKFIKFEVFDSDPVLLSIFDPAHNYPLWICLRVIFLRWLTGELYYTESVSPKQTVFAAMKKHYSRSKDVLVDRICSNKKIVIWTTGLGNYPNNGFTCDRLVEKFATAYPEESLILQPSNYAMGTSPLKFGETYLSRNLSLFQNATSRLETYFKKTLRAAVTELINRFRYLVKIHHDINMKDTHSHILLRRAILLLIENKKLERSFTEFFRNNEHVRLLLLEEGYYGGRSIPFILAAKDAGIHVAEFQHGAIFPGHEAYNIGFDSTNQTLYGDLSPDSFLSYGKWWHNQMRIPNKIVDIGNPHRDNMSKRTQEFRKKKQILILGDGLETEKYMSLARQINSLIEYKVIFRPHPLERDKFERDFSDCAVDIDLSPDIHSALAHTDVIISELSTGLFEAVGTVERIFIWKTKKSEAAFNNMPFETFKSVVELREKLSVAVVDFQNEYSNFSIWERGWLSNYKNFVDPIIK